ncbi:hypothetical protein RB195_022119 [Necator americanus]|uniref:Uncharacterized protein n=1 Tax=Necator americanus TaxID=51031 RepID=A0ABR1EE05_NECAM
MEASTFHFGNVQCIDNVIMNHTENIGRVKWDEFRRDADEVLEEDAIPKAPLWKQSLKLLKILLPHVGLNALLLSYIAMGAIMFIWLEADHELQSRKEKLHKIYRMYDKIINESTMMCSGTVYNSSQVDLRLRPLLRILSRTHEYDDRFTENGQLWNDVEDNMTTRWSFAAAVLYALTVITSTVLSVLYNTENLSFLREANVTPSSACLRSTIGRSDGIKSIAQDSS